MQNKKKIYDYYSIFVIINQTENRVRIINESNMNFLNPLALIGLAAASIPVILHLLNLRKLKTIEFSSLRFLKELQKTKIRKLKIKQILLLILRTLIIIFAVLAFARPTVESSLPLMGQYAKTSTVVLLDNSFSMDVSDEHGNRFNHAKSQTLDIIENMREGDELSIIPMAGFTASQNMIWSRNASFLKEELSKIKVSFTKADLSSAMANAQKMLEESVNLNKQCFIISDYQPNLFYRHQSDSLKYFDGSTSVYAIHTGGESNELRNLSVDSLYTRSRIFRQGKNVEIEAYIKNNSNVDIDGAIVSLYYNDKRVAQRTLDINPEEVKMLEISAPVDSRGFISAKIELEPDILEPDNSRYFGFIVPEEPKIALAGDKKEMSFVGIALNLFKRNEKAATIPNIDHININSPDINNYDVIFLSLENIDSQSLASVRDYVAKGGSVVMFAGDNSTEELDDLMQEFGFGKTEKKVFDRENPARFKSIDKIHPLFEGVFRGTTNRNEIAESPYIYKAMPASGGQNIIDMPSGSFLSEARFGNGKVLYCAVSPGTQWSNLPVTGFFPAFVYRSAYYLSAREEYGNNIPTGESIRLEIPKKHAGGRNFSIIDPNGEEFFAQAAALPQSAILELPALNIPGVYKISDPEGKPIATVSVNVPPSESFFISMSGDKISENLSNWLIGENEVLYTGRKLNITDIMQEAKTGTELWQLFLVLSILTALAEMLVARNKKADTERI